MARRLDLSTSYVNQLENDQRPLTVAVLLRATATFGVDATYFSHDADARLIAELGTAVAGSEVGDVDALNEVVARFPGLARHLVELTRRYEELSTVTTRLSSAHTTAGDTRAPRPETRAHSWPTSECGTSFMHAATTSTSSTAAPKNSLPH